MGLLTAKLYGLSIKAILETEKSVNLGSVYESVVPQELAAHGHPLFYYDNKAKGEVDYIVDDSDKCRVLPVEVKSGKDYRVHSALNTMVSDPEYRIDEAVVLSNEREVMLKKKVLYMSVYFGIFLKAREPQEMTEEELLF